MYPRLGKTYFSRNSRESSSIKRVLLKYALELTYLSYFASVLAARKNILVSDSWVIKSSRALELPDCLPVY